MYELELHDTADRHLGRLLELQATHNGATVFLINDEQRITFAEAEDISNRLAGGFRSLGIGRGERFCFFMGNLPEMVLMCLALNKLGAIWVPICTDYKGEWLLQTLQRSGPALIVTDSEHSQRLGDVLEHFAQLRIIALDGGDLARKDPQTGAFFLSIARRTRCVLRGAMSRRWKSRASCCATPPCGRLPRSGFPARRWLARTS